MEENLETAANAEGELERQALIYQDQWGAASKEVKASLEGIFNDLIPTEEIIDMTKGLAKVIDTIDLLLDSFGGLKSIILLISSIFINKF